MLGYNNFDKTRKICDRYIWFFYKGEELNKFYSSVAELLSPNSFTFDDSISVDSGPDMSMTTETMDNDMYTRYTSDSAY